MTTVWKITQIDYLVSDGFITTAHWTCVANDGDYNASSYGACSFDVITPNIPYASVTEQNVLGWCWSNGVDKNLIEANLVAQIELQKTPVTAIGLPWA